MRNRYVPAFLIPVWLMLAACGPNPFVETTAQVFIPPPDAPLGGDRLPVLDPDQATARALVPVEGTFSLAANGCWTADLGDGVDRLAIFPPDFERPPEDGAAMVGGDGTVVTDGMVFDAFGAVVPASTLPGSPDGFWSNYISFCLPEAVDALVLSEVRATFDATAFGGDALVDLVTRADFSEPWPCGIGFAVSDRLQRVSVQIYAIDSDFASDSPVTLPSAGWTAHVIVGNHLMSNHCNDAIETWTAERQEAARWEIVGGTLDFAPQSEDSCGGGNDVVGILRDAIIDGPSGPIELPDLHIVNRAFGCFAG